MTRDEYFDQLEVPYHVRVEQTAWEQRHTLNRLWGIKGMTLRQLVPIRQKMGCKSHSIERIRQICYRAARDEREKRRPPFERWLKQQNQPRTLYNELQYVASGGKPKPKPKGPRPPRRLPPEWLMTWLRLPKIVDLDLPVSVPLPEGWDGRAQIAYIPLNNTTVFRVLCNTLQGERYCDLLIDHAWDGDTRPLFLQAIDHILVAASPEGDVVDSAAGAQRS